MTRASNTCFATVNVKQLRPMMWWTISTIVLTLIGRSGPLLAHGGKHELGTNTWWTMWNWSPLVASSLAGISVAYLIGWRRLGQAKSRQRVLSSWRPAAFIGAIALLILALLSPIDTLSEQLGWVHMIQHMLIMMGAAPLFIVANTGRVSFWALPNGLRRRMWRFRRLSVRWQLPYYQVTLPLLAWVLFGLVLWVWHLPSLYQAALRDPLTHDMQHIAFFVAACLFWQVLVHPITRRRLQPVIGIMYIFLASLHTTILGALMALSPVTWYPFYVPITPKLGFDPLYDQQLAGFLMWMPACMMYVAIGVTILARWLLRSQTSVTNLSGFSIG